MDFSPINNLPDEILAKILKLVAETPVHALDTQAAAPFPIAATLVNRQWNTVALACPEIWTTIRISDRPRSWGWAALFTKRSQSRALDISINLESYKYRMEPSCLYQRSRPREPVETPLRKILAIVGPHVARWRSIAMRGSDNQLVDFWQFLRNSEAAASTVESAHISYAHFGDPVTEPWRMANLRSLRVNVTLHAQPMDDLLDSLRSTPLRCLDIAVPYDSSFDPQCFQPILRPGSTLTTLILRDFYPWRPPGRFSSGPIDAPTIKFFAVSFSAPFYFQLYVFGQTTGGFDTVMSKFRMPSLEHLEIVGGFTGKDIENSRIHVPEDWEASPFPQLRTLRLEEVGFSRTGLAFIRSLSRDINTLELVYTTGNHHLVAGAVQWPALRTLTIEMAGVVSEPDWRTSFIAMHTRLSKLTLPPPSENGTSLALDFPTTLEIYWLADGPSSALIDGVNTHGFYIDALDGHVCDFMHVDAPDGPCPCGCDAYYYYGDDHMSNSSYEEAVLVDAEEREDERLEECLGEVERRKVKSARREARRGRRRDS
ncbi:hypothetical protein C8R43DRAFT_1122106 [Mycena crocata]|nr:hypothetical protein C8R43DRAFT_1122106 [Mycena crocata]